MEFPKILNDKDAAEVANRLEVVAAACGWRLAAVAFIKADEESKAVRAYAHWSNMALFISEFEPVTKEIFRQLLQSLATQLETNGEAM